MRPDTRSPWLPPWVLAALTACVLTTGVGCEQDNRIRDPLDTYLQLWQPGDNYYYGAYAVTDAFAEVSDVTPNAESWFPGDRGMVYTFTYETAGGTDATFILGVDLPPPYALDIQAGDQVWVTARTEELWIRESSATIHDPDGNLLLAYYTGRFREALHDLDQLPRDTATLDCGDIAYPRLTYALEGPMLSPPVEVTLYQGDTLELDTPAGPYAALLARATIPLSDACVDLGGIEEVVLLKLPD